MKHKVEFTETVLRDAQQSLIATRMPYSVMEPVLPAINKAGYYSVEMWGGATFDTCLRFLDEDPWERLRKISAQLPDTKCQMLLRGQNLLGYKHYPDDMVKKFVELSVKNGIDIIRIFDALNDLRNIKLAVEETLKWGAVASGCISYTQSPVHTLKKYAEMCVELKEMGCQTICIKDMAGVMSPAESYDLVSAIKDSCDLPVILHTHCTTGLAFMTLLKGVEAGADVIDTAISCLSGGTSQPATETLVYALKQLGYEVSVNEDVLQDVNNGFKDYAAECLASGLLDPVVLKTDTNALVYKVPGGMLSNLISQLKAQNAMDKFEEALMETPRVREDMGYPPLVTPTSQIVGVQAVTNVLVGERYKRVSKEITSYLRGEYGTPPGPVNREVLKKVLGDEKPIEGRFADTLEPVFEKTKAELGSKARCDEDVLSYLAFPAVAEKFFEDREKRENSSTAYTIRRLD